LEVAPSSISLAFRALALLTLFAIFSSVTTRNSSPAEGTPERPWTSTGIEGPAFLMGLPLSSSIARTLPLY